MILLKAYPRCRGDVEPTRDAYGNYPHCLQCGRALEEPAWAAPLPAKKGAKKAA